MWDVNHPSSGCKRMDHDHDVCWDVKHGWYHRSIIFLEGLILGILGWFWDDFGMIWGFGGWFGDDFGWFGTSENTRMDQQEHHLTVGVHGVNPGLDRGEDRRKKSQWMLNSPWQINWLTWCWVCVNVCMYVFPKYWMYNLMLNDSFWYVEILILCFTIKLYIQYFAILDASCPHFGRLSI